MRRAARSGLALASAATLVALPLLPLLPAGAATSAPVLVLDGRGHGHGVGMAQDSANAMAAAGASHEQILDLFYPGTQRAVRRSSIRVAVWEAGAPSGAVTVSVPGGARVSGSGGDRDAPPGAVLQVSADGSGFHVRQAPPAGGSAVRGSAVRAGLLQDPSPTPSAGADPLPRLPSPTSSPAASPASSPPPQQQPKPGGGGGSGGGGGGPGPSRSPGSPPATPASTGFSLDSSTPITLSPLRGATLSVTTTGRTYRGSLVALAQQGFRLVNVLDVEDYLKGLGEVPAGWPMAALRTQAVAARTYALRAVGSGSPLGYDVCDDTRCQVYLGVQQESPRTAQAARDTSGQVVTYRGRLADTFYSANAGGVTATPGEGFGGSTTIPYLPGGTRAPGGVDPWRVTASPQDVARRLGYPGRLDAVTVAATGPSGRATSIRLEGAAGPRTLTGVAFQRRLGLRSTLFAVGRGTGTAQPLPAADAAVGQLAPAEAAVAPPAPAAAPSPGVAPGAGPAPQEPVVAAAAAVDELPPTVLGAAVGALLLAAAGTAAGHRLR